jgi:hypothetical protein
VCVCVCVCVCVTHASHFFRGALLILEVHFEARRHL